MHVCIRRGGRGSTFFALRKGKDRVCAEVRAGGAPCCRAEAGSVSTIASAMAFIMDALSRGALRDTGAPFSLSLSLFLILSWIWLISYAPHVCSACTVEVDRWSIVCLDELALWEYWCCRPWVARRWVFFYDERLLAI